MNLAQLTDKISKLGKKYDLDPLFCDFFEEGLLHAIGIEEKPKGSVLQPFNNGIVKLQSNEESKSISKIAISFHVSQITFELLMQRLQERYSALDPMQIEDQESRHLKKSPTFTIDISKTCFEEESLPKIETAIDVLCQDKDNRARFLAQTEQRKALEKINTASLRSAQLYNLFTNHITTAAPATRPSLDRNQAPT